MALYATNGSLNISVVNGSSRTGAYASDGSLNVVVAPDPVTAPVGTKHACGAFYVTSATADTITSHTAADGSLYVCATPFNPSGAQRVTVVSGSL